MDAGTALVEPRTADGAPTGAADVHLDAVGGMAGDMFVAALLAARADLRSQVEADVAAVLPAGLAMAVRETRRDALVGLSVSLEGESPAAPRAFPDLREAIARAPLAPGTAERAVAILTALARAEAEVHGTDIEAVHFHEIADWDTVMDVTAAGSLAAALETISVSTLPLGGGRVRTAHGLLPVPAPATALLLRGFAWHDDGAAGERVTPTGAAILATLCRPTEPRVSGRLAAVGVGFGTRTLAGVPNIVRATVFEPMTARAGALERTALLTCEVDDMTAEEIATAAERLRARVGVRDVVLFTGFGKKGRPVTRFEVQAEPASADALAQAVLSETATLGVRRLELDRHVLERRPGSAAGPLRTKQALRPGGVVTTKVEQDDLSAPTLAERRAQARAAEQ